ncbi:hypothetical protein [Novosphingobium resinovorum]|jgi:hypothetical protein|uniref:hypothetical protein n=2 Tax=Sphingomonadaceae TaxID=41297 RepID=UPI002329D72E|nr:hypothetical protein GCM10017612_04540 [Novosphingobium resinovorum]
MRLMIKVEAPLEITPNPQGGWTLVFWVLDNFNYKAPFRAMLVEIAEALGQNPARSLSLPDYIEDEDFVEGTLLFEGASLRVYYEHGLSYMTLANTDYDLLMMVAQRVQPRIAIA